MSSHLRPVITLAAVVLLTACSTKVVSDQEKQLPTGGPAPKVVSQMTLVGDAKQSYISFTGNMGSLVSHEGRFNTFAVTVKANPGPQDAFANVQIVADVLVPSLQTEDDALTKHLLSSDFFSAEEFPGAKFVSKSVTYKEGTTYDVTGDLLLHGVTKSVSFTANLTPEYLTFTLPLDRTQFGVGGPPEGVKAIDALVPLEAKIVFRR